MSYLLPHLHTGFAVDQAILSVSSMQSMSKRTLEASPFLRVLQGLLLEGRRERSDRRIWDVSRTWFCLLQEESRVVIIRFGHDWDQVCMQMDEVRTQHSALCFATDPRTFKSYCFPVVSERAETNAVWDCGADPCIMCRPNQELCR